MAKCIKCGVDVAIGRQKCLACSTEDVRALLRKNPELKQAFKDTIRKMRQPENIEKMAEQAVPVVEAVSAIALSVADFKHEKSTRLKGAVDHE
ncbi:MAG: hypothetical protein RR365_15510 [Bacteroides sp.]